ncbi:MAG: 2-oxoglutarate dehydrogenase complex dihydrolipoyllysine-residue succinyltransferase [Bdellovibrionales bacterium]|nr:2-oxoglutarate dehydrogenase complex dihydrolipoyllysine-residue succinyltransferase [Bdellovibrionales bacterium]
MDIKVPAVGESVSEATIGEWVKKSGDYVNRDEIILVLETDKASVEVVAEDSGVLQTKAEEGDTVEIGAVVATLDTSAEAPAGAAKTEAPKAQAPAPATSNGGGMTAPKPAPQPQMAAAPVPEGLSPAVRRVVSETGMDVAGMQGTGRGGRLTKADVLQGPAKTPASTPAQKGPSRDSLPGSIDRVPMTTIRKRIAERLVNAQQTAAILTTFNEVDMSALMKIRNQYKETFEKQHGVRLGFMGFFVKAAIEALKAYPAVNASIEGTDILYKNFFNIGIAVSSPKGLVVPVLKDADQMTLAQIEGAITDYAIKARDGKITIDDMSGGTFTISNGGVFGSLMSTPILNPPQSGILGMHKIEKRPVVVDDQVVVRPMMYLALSYDHRMIDGKESVSFLVKIKECIEDPSRILLQV